MMIKSVVASHVPCGTQQSVVPAFCFFVGLQCLTTCVTATPETRCDVPSAFCGEAVNLTCHFSANITAHYMDFFVRKRGLGDVVHFKWTNLTHHKVTAKPGFRLYNNIGMTATVGFLAGQDFTGDYVCTEEIHTHAISSHCTFKLKECATEDKNEHRLTECATEDKNEHRLTDTQCTPHEIGIAVTILSTLIVVLITIQLVWKCFRSLKRSQEKKKDGNGNHPDSRKLPTSKTSDGSCTEYLLNSATSAQSKAHERPGSESADDIAWEMPRDRKTFDEQVDRRVKQRTDALYKQMIELNNSMGLCIKTIFESKNLGSFSEENPLGESTQSTDRAEKKLKKPASRFH